MSNQILGMSVVSAIGTQLRVLFPSVIWYREQIVNLRFPHFFVFQLTVDAEEERRNYWWVQYFINIRYRVASDITTVNNLQEQLDTTGIELLAGLETIDWFGSPLKITNPRYEKVDGVLQFFCNVKIHATKPKAEVVKQMTLELNKELRSE